ncbi:YihY/virulence factor BrkB family protein [Cryobacterium sp. MLB-32]|uniref:YihY/virulence factor BrkB family protein n=1 Tax=Cryobacterium sp. MLB-32 TaxID=1529318 RepID=UPI000689425A|nr:YihY/virulence factor BrkB family protein [Cryobacterium sp. MLB-32]
MKPLIGIVTDLRPVRVYVHFTARGGPIMAGGMSYQAIFAVFAAVWVGFSIAGIFLANTPELTDQLYATINHSVPGLIGEDGVIDPTSLNLSGTFGWTGAIALVGLLFTALAWLSTTAVAVRRIFGIPNQTTFFLIVKLRELGLGLLFGLALIASAVVSLASTTALDAIFGFAGISQNSFWYQGTARGVGIALVLLIDTVTLAALFRVLSRVHIPFRRLVTGALLGGLALGVMKILGGALLGGATRNPLLATFAVIIGLLIWFNLVSTVILLAASWIAVGLQDVGIVPASLSAKRVADEENREAAEHERAQAEAALASAREAYLARPWFLRPGAARRVRAADEVVKNLPPVAPR